MSKLYNYIFTDCVKCQLLRVALALVVVSGVAANYSDVLNVWTTWVSLISLIMGAVLLVVWIVKYLLD